MILKPYRKNAAVMIFNDAAQLLVFERVAPTGHRQCPQGGIDEGEDALAAAYRELREETGLSSDSVTLLGEHPDWLTYQYPNDATRINWRIAGQTQRWFYFRFIGSEAAIQLEQPHQEFTAYRWQSPEEVLRQIVSFKQPVYRQAITYASSHIIPLL